MSRLHLLVKVFIIISSVSLLYFFYINETFILITNFCILFFLVMINLYIYFKKIDTENKRRIEERKKILLNSGIYEIDEMSGREFEQYLKYLYIKAGYKVRLTPASGDFGADLILEKETQRIAVQAKRYKSKVGIKAIQEIASAKTHYRATETWVVTNNYFTSAAVALAQSNGLKLYDREALIKYSLKYREFTQTIPPLNKG